VFFVCFGGGGGFVFVVFGFFLVFVLLWFVCVCWWGGVGGGGVPVHLFFVACYSFLFWIGCVLSNSAIMKSDLYVMS